LKSKIKILPEEKIQASSASTITVGPDLLPTTEKSQNHLATRFQRIRFLEINHSETRIACGGHVCKWIGTK
jgi:hypothetical protein